VPPGALLADALEAMGPQASAAGLALDVADGAAAETLPTVSADADRVAQVFSNLIGNAIKFTPQGGRIVLGATAADGMVWFSVTDTGPGIPAEQLPNVFGRFWQASRRDGRGIGLGLAIAQGIVEAHGGRIGVDSEVGVGTRFWFGVPVIPTARSSGLSDAPTEDTRPPRDTARV
jgi:signal transduction histidine kinase